MKRNGGILGPNREPRPEGTNGIYDLYDQYNSVLYDLWTRSAGYSSITYDRGAQVFEGDTLVFNVTTVGVSNNSRVYWFLFNINGVDSSDFVGGATSGNFTINNNLGSFTIRLATDTVSEPNQQFRIQLREQNNVNAAVVLQTGVIQILEPGATLSAPSSVNEGSVVNVQVTTTDFANGTLNWELEWGTGLKTNTDMDAFDGTVNIVNSQGTITFTVLSDLKTEPTQETFRILLKNGANTIGSSSYITINDTSQGSLETSETFFYGTSVNDENYVRNTGNFIEYKGSFLGGQSIASPYQSMFAWRAMMTNTPATGVKIEFYDSTYSNVTPIFTTTDVTTVNGICSAFRNGNNYNGADGWSVYLGCVNGGIWNSFVALGGSTGGIANNSTDLSFARYIGRNLGGCFCSSGGSVFGLRPHIGNQNWGGYNSTCGSTSRSMYLRIYTS